MKKLLLATLLLSTTVQADWAIDSYDSTKAYSKGSVGETTMSAEYSTNGETNIYFNVGNFTCSEYKQSAFSRVITINGQRVKAKDQCIGKGESAVFVATDAGYRFLLNELKTKNLITIKYSASFSETYSAVGFNEAWAKINSQLNKAI